jgi:acylpyruvate hydrolase
MRVATLRTGGGTRAARVDDDYLVEIDGVDDVGQLLQDQGWRDRATAASGRTHRLDTADYAPLIPSPDKIICIGLNYRNHILEVGRELPKYPTLFAKYRGALIGAHDNVQMPPASVSEQIDWEAELAVVIGRPARNVTAERAADVIAGYSVLNDVTVRDFQNHTLQWIAGKTFESSTPLGPWLVTPDDAAIADKPGYDISCHVDGEEMQHSNTSDLLFDPCALIEYITTIITLLPGDVIATGTPGGIGHARQPPRYLHPGSKMVTRIEGVGELVNECRITNPS